MFYVIKCELVDVIKLKPESWHSLVLVCQQEPVVAQQHPALIVQPKKTIIN